MRQIPATVWAIFALLAGCATDQPDADAERPSGKPLELELEAGGFVRFEDRRLAVEEFLYELRLRCRAVETSGEQESMPWLLVTAPANEQPGVAEMIPLIKREAYYAGVRYVEFE